MPTPHPWGACHTSHSYSGICAMASLHLTGPACSRRADWCPLLRWTRQGGEVSRGHSFHGPVCPNFHFSPWLNWPSPAGDSHICQASCRLLLLARWLYCLPWSNEGQSAAGESLKLTWLFRFHFLPALLHVSIYGRGLTR